MLGLALVLAVYAILAATIIAGGIFLKRVSAGGFEFKSFFGWLRAFKHPGTWISLILIIFGLALIADSYTATSTTFDQVTGYRYLLGEQPIHYWMDGWVLTVYKYRLYEYPVRIWDVFYDAFFEPLRFLAGLALILLGLYLGAYWLAKATNRAYGIR